MIELQNPSDESIKNSIVKKETFTVHATGGDLLEYCTRIESLLESANMSCRVRTKNRTAINTGALLTGVGVFGFLAQAAHNIATYNPDWEIIRNPLNNKIEVRNMS